MGTQSDLTFLWAGSGVSRCLPALFSTLTLCAYDTCVCAAICCTIISRENKVDFGVLRVFC